MMTSQYTGLGAIEKLSSASEVSRVPPVPLQLDNLGKAIAQHLETVSVLNKRLSAVMTPQQPADTNEKEAISPKENLSQAADRIRDFVARINIIDRECRIMLDRLEV